jgi:hypothetical protein
VHRLPPYSNRGQRDMANEEDRKYPGPSTDSLIQSNAGGHFMLNMTHHDDDEEARHGYIGILNVVVNANQTGS